MVKKLILLLLPLTLILFTHVVNARDISSFDFGNKVSVIDSITESLYYTSNSSPWAGQGDGYLTFSFALYKVGGISTSTNSMLKNVTVYVGSAAYSCNVGTSSMSNSTFNNGLYSATCPVYIDSNGLTAIRFVFQDFQSNDNGSYRFSWNGLITYDHKSNTSVNVDTSSTTNAVNNQTNDIKSNANYNADRIIDSQEDLTQDIIDSQDTNTNSIKSNANYNTDRIISNDNDNTDKQIESQKVCSTIDKQNVVLNNKFLDSSGTEVNGNNAGITDYININLSTIKVVNNLSTSGGYYCFYNVNKSLISCSKISDLSNEQLITIPNNSYYFRSTINTQSNRPTYNVCQNGNQAVVNSQNDINNTLNDDNVDNPNDDISSLSDQVSSTDSISDIFLLPIRLIQIILNSLNSTSCSSINLGSLYGSNLTFTCINLQSILGNTLYNLIDLFFAFGIIFGLRKYILEIFTKITSLKEDNLND